MFRSFALARIVRVLGVMVQGKVPLLDALGLARQTARNVHFAELVAGRGSRHPRRDRQRRLRREPAGGPLAGEAVRSGEQSGRIGDLLISVRTSRRGNEGFVKTLTSVIEPLILIVLGVVVGFIAVSMFLPLFDLTSAAH